MTRIAFDPVGGELTIEHGDGRPPLSLPTAEVDVRFYGQGGILACLADGGGLELAFLPVEAEPAELVIEPLAPGRWRVRLEPAGRPEGDRR